MKLMSMKKIVNRGRNYSKFFAHVLKVTRLIGQEAAKLDMFLSMPNDCKVIFTRQEIDNSN